MTTACDLLNLQCAFMKLFEFFILQCEKHAVTNAGFGLDILINNKAYLHAWAYQVNLSCHRTYDVVHVLLLSLNKYFIPNSVF